MSTEDDKLREEIRQFQAEENAPKTEKSINAATPDSINSKTEVDGIVQEPIDKLPLEDEARKLGWVSKEE